MSLIEKCRYYNNHCTASVLMIDDVVPIAISEDGKIGPHNDWGYLLTADNSLYNFFYKNLLIKYPYIKGTFFIPLDSQSYLDKNSSYFIYTKDTNGEFSEFINSLNDSFEVAFHGVRHTYYSNNELIIEYENFKPNEEAFQDISFANFPITKKFSGGKFPAYQYNTEAIRFVEKKNFKWMAFDSKMINKKSNNFIQYKPDSYLIDIPTNISGDVFEIFSRKKMKRILKWVLGKSSFASAQHNLLYLYKNRLPITIQEHFQNQREDGKRQHPNVYDDIISLNKIYAFLEKLDIWYTNCTDLAHYFDSYDKTEIMIEENFFHIKYNGLWNEPMITIKTKLKSIIHLETNEVIDGIPSQGFYLYSLNKNGNYSICQ